MRLATTALLLALALATTLQAQTVFRCGNAYSQQPCERGVVVDVTDARGPAQQAEAQQVASNERRLAASLRRDRLALEREQDAAFAGAINVGGAVAEPTNATRAASARKRRLATPRAEPADRDFVALDPSSRRRASRN